MITIDPPLGTEQIATAEQLDAQVLTAARVYLDVAGPTRIGDLVRVLAQHLGTSRLKLVHSSVMASVAEEALSYNASALVSLPAGRGKRDTEGAS